jgi:hypothetical protein
MISERLFGCQEGNYPLEGPARRSDPGLRLPARLDWLPERVSQKWLQGYLNEYVWRYKRRDFETPTFFGTGISKPFGVRCTALDLSRPYVMRLSEWLSH